MSIPAPDRLRRLAPYALVGGIATFLYYVATQFEFHRRAGVLGPDFWPKLILALAITVCVIEILRIVLSRADDEGSGLLENIAQAVDTDAETETEIPAAEEHHPLLLLAGIGATIGYVALVATTGFFLTTAAYLAAFLVIGGYRRRRAIAALSVGGALLLMFVFMKLVYVSLPIGSGPFAEVTLLLMRLMGIR